MMKTNESVLSFHHNCKLISYYRINHQKGIERSRVDGWSVEKRYGERKFLPEHGGTKSNHKALQ